MQPSLWMLATWQRFQHALVTSVVMDNTRNLSSMGKEMRLEIP